MSCFKKVSFLMVLIVCCICLLSCQPINKHVPEDLLMEDMYREPTKTSSYKELSQTIGKSSFQMPISEEFPLEINDPNYMFDNESPTGKWIKTDGEGRFGYTIPNGIVEAGSHIQVGLIHTSNDNNELDRNVRVIIDMCTNSNNCTEPLIKREEYVAEVEDDFFMYEGNIPTTKDRLYRISLEIVHEGTIEDTLISYIYVPNDTVNASIEIKEEKEESISFLLTNFGPTTLTIGEDFRIEQFIDEAWHIVPYQMMVKDIALILYPGNHTSFTVDTSTFPAGTYRFVKELHANPYGADDVIATPFTLD